MTQPIETQPEPVGTFGVPGCRCGLRAGSGAVPGLPAPSSRPAEPPAARKPPSHLTGRGLTFLPAKIAKQGVSKRLNPELERIAPLHPPSTSIVPRRKGRSLPLHPSSSGSAPVAVALAELLGCRDRFHAVSLFPPAPPPPLPEWLQAHRSHQIGRCYGAIWFGSLL